MLMILQRLNDEKALLVLLQGKEIVAGMLPGVVEGKSEVGGEGSGAEERRG